MLYDLCCWKRKIFVVQCEKIFKKKTLMITRNHLAVVDSGNVGYASYRPTRHDVLHLSLNAPLRIWVNCPNLIQDLEF